MEASRLSDCKWMPGDCNPGVAYIMLHGLSEARHIPQDYLRPSNYFVHT